LARVAAAQGLCIVNAAYTYDTAILERLGRLSAETEVVAFSASDLPQAFEELTVDERRRAHPLLHAAAGAIRGYGCELHVKQFHPADQPALDAAGDHASFVRDLERAKEGSDALFASLLGGIAAQDPVEAPHLYLNLYNPVIVRLLGVESPELCRILVEMIY